MAKIENDKYYTPVELSKYCIDKTFEIIGEDNITDIIEPSAGDGSFSNQLFFLSTFAIAIMFSSCKKDDPEPEPVV